MEKGRRQQKRQIVKKDKGRRREGQIRKVKGADKETGGEEW